MVEPRPLYRPAFVRSEIQSTSTLQDPWNAQAQSLVAPTPTASCYSRKALLHQRQQSDSPPTCGYIRGDPASAVTCPISWYCATSQTYVGCCEASPATCVAFYTTCYDFLGSNCDNACLNNPQNLVCDTNLPYCAEYLYEGASTGYGCASFRGYTVDVLLTSKTNLGVLTTSTPQTPTSVNNSSVSTTKSSAEAGSGSQSGFGTGAIVGVSVGGVAIIALLALLILCVRRRRNRDKTTKNVAYSNIPNLSENPTLEAMSYQGYKKESPSTLNTFPSPRSDARGYSWQGSTTQNGSHFGYHDLSSSFPMGQLHPVEMPSQHVNVFPSELESDTRQIPRTS
ncbi:hypothetical protein PV10_00015 [Exophiala mesophila]|uniref:Mid2 domain-containing protein n=1 Tax=Exophiala mesophila TaxID=212818 RepID=A0A0D1Y624_EXOME|nr:uncharacterized protein PV10_00015 [Exophiala mesophila]KIV96111.1 hypothetical protein PV10_00015 [Exophiala mesophila]